ncbi:MAG: sugar O-acetyltransferase [Oscillospiraceae bacterium]|nr:sugar O-acetyltransferase [Oscillospiraceae bacterium]
MEKKRKAVGTMLEKLHSGELYFPGDDEILALQSQCLERLYEYNHTRPGEQARREALLREMFAAIGEGCYLEPPLHANWAGRFVRLGKNVYANFGLTLVDDTEITVGDYTMFGPNVVVATAGHPILPELRQQGLQYNAPVHIGRNCWIGAGALIMPGVTIGDGTVVGAGSVVTGDLPANVVAVGVPCRVLRPVGEQDRQFYFRGRRIPEELLPQRRGEDRDS